MDNRRNSELLIHASAFVVNADGGHADWITSGNDLFRASNSVCRVGHADSFLWIGHAHYPIGVNDRALYEPVNFGCTDHLDGTRKWSGNTDVDDAHKCVWKHHCWL